MKLEVGKTYVARNGHRAKVTNFSHKSSRIVDITWLDDRQGPRDIYVDGRQFDESPSRYDEHDLIKEFVDNTIPHADLIRAVLDGKVVQWCVQTMLPRWVPVKDPHDAIKQIIDNPDRMWRLKPEPVVRWAVVSQTQDRLKTVVVLPCSTEADARYEAKGLQFAKVQRTEFDPDTLDIISARTEAP